MLCCNRCCWWLSCIIPARVPIPPNCSQCWAKGVGLLHSPETGSGLTGATSQGSLGSFHHHHQHHHTHTLFPTPAVDQRVIGRCKSLAPLLQSRASLQWDLNFPQWDQGSHPGLTPSPSLFCFTMVFWEMRLSQSHKLNPCLRITLWATSLRQLH